MVAFYRQFFSSDVISEVWDYIFKFLNASPVGILISFCLISFVVYLFARVIFN